MLAIHKILHAVADAKGDDDKVAILRQNNHTVLRNILILTYDEKWTLMVPNEAPRYRPCDVPRQDTALYKQGRKLKYIVKEMTGETRISQIKREQIFIDILETIHPNDAEVLVQMIQRKPFAGLTKTVINRAFGDIISDGRKKKD